MINRYSKGANFERKVVNYLKKEPNFLVVFRSAGSHSPIDIVAVMPNCTMLIQCKTSGHVSNADILKLLAIQNKAIDNSFRIYIAYLDKGKIVIIPLENYKSSV